MIREITFNSSIAFDAWQTNNYPHIAILSVGSPMSDFGYEVSIRLKKPEIKVTYIDFRD